MKIFKIKEDITSEIASSFKNSIAIDTEATGLQIPSRDKLSLIQICDEDKNIYIIQPNKNNYNAPNLVKLLSSEKITKIFHYGRADLAHIKYYLKTDTNNILDTKIASKLARSYSDNHSLKMLIKSGLSSNSTPARSATS